MIKVDLKGNSKEFEAGVTAAEVAKSIGMGLYKSACAARIDGEACDLRTPLEKDCALEILTFDDPEGKHAFWHTAAHVMAQAVQHLFPEAKFGIGPALENGWYYDIKAGRPLSTADFEAIEAEMKKIVKADLPVEKRRITAEEGRSLFAGQDYKLELLEEYAAKGWDLSVYQQGDFTDLCAGPHLMSTGALKAVKLLKVAAAYWRADAARDSLDRLYGVAFPKASLLDEYLALLDAWVESQPHVYYTKPQAGTTALVYYDLDIPSYEFCRRMYGETGAFVTPGACFEQEHCVRVGYACDKQTLADGLAAFGAFLAAAAGQ